MDLSEKQVDALCMRAGDEALKAVGALGDYGPMINHITLFAAASSLMGVAAQLVVRDETGQHPPANAPMVVALIHNWADALKLYPDSQAIARRLTELREHLGSGAIVPLWYEATPQVRRLIEQIASMRDPLSGDKDPDVDDCVETLSTIIRGAKAIAGDLEEPEEDNHTDDAYRDDGGPSPIDTGSLKASIMGNLNVRK